MNLYLEPTFEPEPTTPPGNGVTAPRTFFLAHEFAVHHRHAPVARAVHQLGNLVAVAEETQAFAERDAIGGVQPGVTGGGGGGHDGLADALQHLFRELPGGGGEDEHGNAGPAVGGMALVD